MKLSDFAFDLPLELIKGYPTPNREEARLMVAHRSSGKIESGHYFRDIINYMADGDVLVVNNTKVFPARLEGVKEKTNAAIKVFLLRELDQDLRLWDVLVDPARKIRIGNKLYFGDTEPLVAEVVDNTTSRGRTLRFLYDGDNEAFRKLLFTLGSTPLPESLGRPVEPEDAERYQSIFATEEGAVAAPTASLHFSRELVLKLKIKGIKLATITLHAGLSNFRHIEVEDLSKHKADAEQMNIDERAEQLINEAKTNDRQVCAVGTTVIRTLESSVTSHGKVRHATKWTNKFIFPPYNVQVPTMLIANFYQPKTPMMMSAAAFTGYDLLMEMYHQAVQEGYGFGTFGDAMLVI